MEAVKKKIEENWFFIIYYKKSDSKLWEIVFGVH